MKTGTIGELLVQLRMLQFGVQAAPPLKDTGNDLIAVRGNVIRAIQVKTSTKNTFDRQKLPRHYDILAAVQLIGDGDNLQLDDCEIYLIQKEEVRHVHLKFSRLSAYRLNREIIERLF